MKAVAVVGSARQLGALVVDRLIAHEGVQRIVAMDTAPPLSASDKLVHVELPSQISLEDYLNGCTTLIHTGETDAGSTGVSYDTLLKAAIHAGVEKLICVTSAAAYGAIPDHPVPLVETSPRRAPHDGRRQRDALEMEAVLDELERVYPQVAVARLRPGILFGVRAQGLPVRALRYGWCPDMGYAVTPIVWDEDVADAVWSTLEKGAAGAFNLGTEDMQPLAQLAKAQGLRLVKLPASAQRALIHGASSAAVAVQERCDPHWLAIADVSLYVSSKRAQEELGWDPKCRTAPSVIARYLEQTPRRLNVRIATFFGLLALARYLPKPLRSVRGSEPPGMSSGDARLRFVLTGEDGGELGVIIERGRPRVQAGPLHAPDTVITMPARLLMEMLSGEADPSAAQQTGIITTQGAAFQLLAFNLIQGFRAVAQSKGLWNRPARWIARWIGQG